ncbi:PilX N-terminal domain-containing pilus assembly protein [Pseudomonas sp. MYb185]|uniref:pilus assembly PilX family protein n=1 Tax=Pseudomonas sp. MYb185 TaxID=1848729 RepID=UPI000CFBD204|nr:PilX N-terminal domain-containing pilus assembly protein [Pseudomonas sp. MYb185]PRB84467.1 hypothetical protein CQ007_01420 [Pseudomonas sp. MYb185]
MNSPVRQQGAVLMVSLIMLLLLTVIAVTASNVSTLQVRMASNSQLQNIAFQAAESGIRHGQEDINGSGKSGTLDYAADTSAGIAPKYAATTVIMIEPGSSLDAAGEGGGTSLVRYQVRISSHGKACDESDTSCDPTTTDNRPRAQHLLGCKIQAVAAPLCKQGS